MKKLLIIMPLAVLAVAAFSQEPNRQLLQLEQYLQEQGYSISHTQSSGRDRGITHQWQALLTMANAIDSIRITFASLGKDASESYLYEYHKNGTDTIKYSLAFHRDNDTLRSFRYGNNVYFSNALEVASFDYTHRNESDGRGATDRGNYNHLYTSGNDLSWDDMKPFDHTTFETLIAPALKAVKKLKGVKANPVYWRHDEGFDDEIVPNGNLISKTVRYTGNTSKHYGLTTGKCYFIPKQHEAEAKALYQQLDSLAHDYVDRHPEQYYTYSFSSDYPNRNLTDMLHGLDIDGDSDYDLMACATNDGFYILSINTKGELWIPKDWPKLKSYINSVKTYIKGMEP